MQWSALWFFFFFTATDHKTILTYPPMVSGVANFFDRHRHDVWKYIIQKKKKSEWQVDKHEFFFLKDSSRNIYHSRCHFICGSEIRVVLLVLSSESSQCVELQVRFCSTTVEALEVDETEAIDPLIGSNMTAPASRPGIALALTTLVTILPVR